MVIGRDLLPALGIKIDFQEQVVQWNDQSVRVTTGKHDSVKGEDSINDGVTDEYEEVKDSSIRLKELVTLCLLPQEARDYL